MSKQFAARGLSLAAVALLVAGCATPLNQPMTAETTQSISNNKAVPGVQQSEIGAIINVQNSGAVAGQFGLIGALIGAAIDSSVNASRTRSAEELLGDIRNDLIEFDFKSAYFAKVNKAAERGELLNAKQVEPATRINDDDLSRIARTAREDAVLFLLGDYNFTSDFSAVRTGIRALMVRRADAIEAGSGPLKPKDAIYRSTVIASVGLPDADDDAANNAERWSENDSTLVRDALLTGIEHAMQVLAMDLQAPDYEAAAARYGKQTKIDNLPSKRVGEIEGAKIYRRLADGSLFAMSNVEPRSPEVATQ